MKSAAKFPVESARRAAYSVEAEQSVLGSLLIDPSAWQVVSPILRAKDFYRADHRLIFAGISALAREGKPCDVVTLSEQLERSGQIEEAGGLHYLGTIARDTPSGANAHSYAEIVHERSQLRELEAMGPEIARSIADGVNSADVLYKLRSTLDRMDGAALAPRQAEPLKVEPVSAWQERAAPAPRDWVIDGLVPARRVTSFLADGGLGKTTIAMQIGVHVAMGRPLYGLPVSGGPVLGIFCEDEEDELRRRADAACNGEGLELEHVDRFIAVSRDGQDNVLCAFENDRIVFTPFYRELEATVAAVRPRLLILDTLADFFAGDYMNTTHARQFIRTGLGGLSMRYECAVLLIAHPSMSGMQSGEGAGFSTAWNNAVRSRLYLRRPKTDDVDAAQDRRVLEVRKSNYAATGVAVPLVWRAGAFAPDPDPVEEGSTVRAAKVDTRLAIAARGYFQSHAASGSVVGFGTLFEALQANGDLPRGVYQTVRKPLQRAIKELERAGLIVPSQLPRGYRLAEIYRGQRGHSGDNAGIPGTLGTRDNGDTPIRGVSPLSPYSVPSGAMPQ